MKAAQDRAYRATIEGCHRDCAAARAAIAAARDILEDAESDTRWEIQAWALPAPKGEIRLTLAGEPALGPRSGGIQAQVAPRPGGRRTNRGPALRRARKAMTTG